MYIEMDWWVLLILCICALILSVLTFISQLKYRAIYRDIFKPKKDELQELLNEINNKIIELEEANKQRQNESLEARKMAFVYVKGMILGAMHKNEIKEKGETK